MEKYKYTEAELAFLENAPVPLAIYQYVNGQVLTLALSNGFLELFGFSDLAQTKILMDKDMYRDCHPNDIAMLEDAAVQFATNKKPYNVIYRSKVDGKYKIIHAYGEHIQKPGGVQVAVIWYSDEGDYKEEIDEQDSFLSSAYSNLLRSVSVDRLLQYDYLTGFPTASHFFYLCDTNYVPKARELGEMPAMIFFDMSGMKRFNAKHGFAEGDKLIAAFSRLLAQTFDSNHCCRIGMDRFCAYVMEKDLQARLEKVFTDCEKINGGKSVPVRAGIYSAKVEYCGSSLACDRAKMACDSGKAANISGFTWFDKSMLEASEKRQYIIENIDRAIEEKWIKVYYQPIIRAANDRVCDEEALARWIDPKEGFMSPADFIPALEDSNLIYKLDLFITEQVLQKLKAQEKADIYTAPISINLSRSDFDSCDIVEEINKHVKAAGVPPEKLTIEITESVLGHDFDYMKEQVKRFQELGFKVWMDDFGSGYSGLDALLDIKFDLVKFDMKFMKEFYKNEKSRVMLSGMMKIAAELGIETICEGVETIDQVEFLKEIGCAKLQGFYYCKPIPMEEIFERYEKGTQIGFENPAETEYYAQIGKINLYNLSVITNANDEIYKNVFNTPPMLILEMDDKEIKIVRGNKSYKEFVKKNFRHIARDGNIIGRVISINEENRRREALFFEAIRRCKGSPDPIIVEQRRGDGSSVHLYLKRISTNPVTKVVAIVAVILNLGEIS